MQSLASHGETQALGHGEEGADLLKGHGRSASGCVEGMTIEFYQSIQSKNQLNKYMSWRNTASHCDPIKNKRGVYGRFRQTREFL
ncbi:eukaryotic release factor 3 GTPase subunit [Pseudomonas sp. St290]|nr:eukaryotic release factor 3 GTPase subunit [Pseudomonas sp. St290]